MFKISEFSQLSQVSVKTLRYYDQLGLLKPAHTDSWTGYRYYTAEQLLRLNRILAFKELGFTLEQITRLLDEQVPPEQIRGMFRLKQAQIQGLIESEGRLRQIEREGGHASHQEIMLKAVEPQLVVSIRERTAPAYIPLLFEELDRYLAHHGISSITTLPHLVLWHGCEECEDATDLEVVCPIARHMPESERVHIQTLSALPTVAALMHQCQPQSACPASLDLAKWIETHPYRMVANQPRREIYLTRETDGFSIAEVQIAVEAENAGEAQ